MKKLILITPILLIVHFAQAQFENKQYVLGGNVYYNTTNGSLGSSTLSLYPMLGKAIKENQLITAQFGFSNSSGSSYVSRGYSA